MKKLSRTEWIGVIIALVVTFGMLFFGNIVFQPATQTPTPAEIPQVSVDTTNTVQI
ncbi:MAG: hypothetical protein V4467_00355 [Patescibacteria group bacterium]